MADFRMDAVGEMTFALTLNLISQRRLEPPTYSARASLDGSVRRAADRLVQRSAADDTMVNMDSGFGSPIFCNWRS
jgi:hypothetical protein